METEEFSYLHRRERQHRGAAKTAATTAARRAHQELAESYAVLLLRLRQHDPVQRMRSEGLI